MPGVRKTELTDGQKQCLRLVAAHHTSKEIARILEISHFTVDQRLDAARRKLNVDTRREAALLFAEMEKGNLSERFVYEAAGIVEPPRDGQSLRPTSDRGYASARQDRVASQLFAERFIRLFRGGFGVPPIGGRRHRMARREIFLQSLAVALYASLVLGVASIILKITLTSFG